MQDFSLLSDDEVLEIYLTSSEDKIISSAQAELFRRNKPLCPLSNVNDDDELDYGSYEYHIDTITN